MKVEHQMSPRQRDQTLIDDRALNLGRNTYRTESYLYVSIERACGRQSLH